MICFFLLVFFRCKSYTKTWMLFNFVIQKTRFCPRVHRRFERDWSKSYKIDLESFMRHQYLTQKTPQCCPRHMIWDQEHHHVDWCLAQNPEPLGVVWRRCDGGATTPTFTWEAHRFGTLSRYFLCLEKKRSTAFQRVICPVRWVRDHSKLIHWGNPK